MLQFPSKRFIMCEVSDTLFFPFINKFIFRIFCIITHTRSLCNWIIITLKKIQNFEPNAIKLNKLCCKNSILVDTANCFLQRTNSIFYYEYIYIVICIDVIILLLVLSCGKKNIVEILNKRLPRILSRTSSAVRKLLQPNKVTPKAPLISRFILRDLPANWHCLGRKKSH